MLCLHRIAIEDYGRDFLFFFEHARLSSVGISAWYSSGHKNQPKHNAGPTRRERLGSLPHKRGGKPI